MEHREEQQDSKKSVLLQFKETLSDVWTPEHTDATLMKFLRAGNFCLAKSEHLFRESLWCRAVYELDALTHTTQKHQVAEKYEFVNHLGYAKDGTPVTYVALGRGDLQGFILSMSSYDIGLYCSLLIEADVKRGRESGHELGKEMNEVTYVIDMEGFELKNILHTSVIEVAFDLFRIVQDLYPEVWKHLLIINAAFYVYQSYNIFRPIFRDMFVQKLRIASKEDTPALLLEYVDSEVLPVFLGGTRVDSKGDSMCSEFMKFGGPVDASCYSVHRPVLRVAEAVWIQARSYFNHSVLVREPNARLRIEIRTEGGSISTSMLYRAFGPAGQVDFPSKSEFLNPRDLKCNVCQVSPTMKLQTHLTPADICCRAPRPGLYIFKFDNTSNWLTARKLIFCIRVLPPS